jgi:ribonuclease J
VKLFKETVRRVFVAWSGQEHGRTVTLYRACEKAGRTLVIDLAEVLDMLGDFVQIPQAGWADLKV